MKPISLHDVAAALAHCDPEQLATALAQAGAESITRATDALEAAAHLVATFPRDEVVAEADALLYDVLRWPVSDAVPGWQRLVTPESFAARQGIGLADAQSTLKRLDATETDAARALLDAGPIANYTLEQSQVICCIETLMEQDVAPTRDLVRRTALEASRAVMHPDDGDSPIVYSLDEGLAPRFASPSPRVHAVLWLGRMELEPPPPGVLADRLAWLQRAAQTMGAAAAGRARVIDLPRLAPSVEAAIVTPEATGQFTVMGLVS
jgi:hypothetical protein